MANAQAMLICSPARVANSGEAVCSECGSPIYPTLGSLKYARENAMKMICTNCVSAGPDYIFGGLMHHGQMVPLSDDQASDLMAAIERDAHRRREEKSQADGGSIQ